MQTTTPRRASSMRSKRPSGRPHAGSRLPVALVVLAVLLMLLALPARVRAAPSWIVAVVGLGVLVPMAGVMLTNSDPRWLRAERAVTFLFCGLMGVSNIAILGFLVRAMLRETPASSALVLLSSGTAVWVTNVLVFSLLFWQMDRGGPEARTANAPTRPDWQFAQTQARGDVAPGWRPQFIDYLALGFSTATAFSAADALPLTPRGKALMMLESLISLVTIVIVAGRAINVLGS